MALDHISARMTKGGAMTGFPLTFCMHFFYLLPNCTFLMFSVPTIQCDMYKSRTSNY